MCLFENQESKTTHNVHAQARARESTRCRIPVFYVLLVVLVASFLVPAIRFISVYVVIRHSIGSLLSLPVFLPITLNKNYRRLDPTSAAAAERAPSPPASGTFNGIPIYYKDGRSSASLHSTVHCVGENHGPKAWMYRSCQFRNLCFDVSEREFVLFRSPQEKRLQEILEGDSDLAMKVTTSSTMVSAGGMASAVSLGALHRERSYTSMRQFEWFPVVRDHELNGGYYLLPDSHVLVPFHSLAAFEEGNLLWDDFLPIYTLLSIFGLQNKRLSLMRRAFPEQASTTTCDSSKEQEETCQRLFHRFLPAMGLPSTTESFGTTHVFSFLLNPGKDKDHRESSNLVCARYGAAGLGMISDPGVLTRGWKLDKEYRISYNVARVAMLWEFRQHMTRQLRIRTDLVATNPPFKLVFSASGTIDFTKQMDQLRQTFSGDELEVECHRMDELDVWAQARIAASASIFVTLCRGDLVSATFLPQGASLIVYCDEWKTEEAASQGTDLPTRTGADLLSNSAYFRFHRLPFRHYGESKDIAVFVDIIRNELKFVRQQSSI